MINHSCVPNCTQSDAVDTSEMRVYANREIEKNEEITICYLGENVFSENRKESLREWLKFDCECPLCKGTRKQLAERNSILVTIKRLLTRVQPWKVSQTNRRAYVNNLKTLLHLLKSEGLGGYAEREVYCDAMIIMSIQKTACTSQMENFGLLWYDYTCAQFGVGNETSEVVEICRDWAEGYRHKVPDSWPVGVVSGEDPPSDTEQWLWKIE
jgi:hypothetical protein